MVLVNMKYDIYIYMCVCVCVLRNVYCNKLKAKKLLKLLSLYADGFCIVIPKKYTCMCNRVSFKYLFMCYVCYF
jgi:hypothetical protein